MEPFVPALVTFFVIVDPIGIAPVFATLTAGTSRGHKVRMAIKSTVLAALILVGFAYGGAYLLGAMGISLDAFRAAGGILLFLIALDMIFEKRTERREKRTDEIVGKRGTAADDISVFPMAIPMMAGPGAIATVMLYMKGAEGDLLAQASILGAAGIVLLSCMLIFLAVGPIMRLVGDTVAQTIGRILGVILAALSVQLVFDAIGNVFLS